MGKIFSNSVKQRGLLGKKLGMAQHFDEQGNAIPVTLVELGPCVVAQKKSQQQNGYNALQLAYGHVRENLPPLPFVQHFKKNGLAVKPYLKEFKGFDGDSYSIGDEIKLDIFAEGDTVSVTGLSKGKGYAGVYKRYGFGGGRKTHGSHFHRSPGAIGACATPSKTFKGIKLPGRMGNNRVTIKNLRVIKIDTEKNIVAIKGAIPGRPNSVVAVSKKGE